MATDYDKNKRERSERFDPEIARLLKSVRDNFLNEDRATRERQVRHYQRLKLYWNNLSRIYWSETARDYRIANQDEFDSTNQAYYDRPVNVFQAFLQTIIAALSVQIPAVVCIPDDIDNPSDITTAKAGNIIGEQIYKQNDVIFLWLMALYVHCTEGMVACYHYPKEDEAYGTYEETIFKDEEIEAYVCPGCGYQMKDEEFDAAVAPQQVSGLGDEGLEQDEALNPDTLELEDLEESSSEARCPNCRASLDTELKKSKLVVPRFSGTKRRNKARICTEVYGGLYVRVANYAKQQCDTPFLDFSYETHYVNALERYPHLRDKISKSGINPFVGGGVTGGNYYEAMARLNPEYGGNIPDNNVTIGNTWFRPCAFNVLMEEDYKKLLAKFPSGCKIVLVNDECAEYVAENLDDRWTLTVNPLSDYLTHEPLGELLVNIQDIVNDLISLVIQTIEHGVTQTWADPAVVNFNAQEQIEANPGLITATKPVGSSRNISDAFFASNAATLSPEVFNFYRIVQELGQFVSGALPSLFGGNPGRGSSQTASEYAMSKGMAMQRLQTPWKMMTIWWKTIFGKVIPQYMAEIVEDEKFTRRGPNGNFVKVFIRKSELDGKIGEVELDASEQVPVSDDQKAEIVTRLLETNNAEILSALVSPENLPFIRKIVKVPEFRLPGEDDRTKIYEDIDALLQEQAVVLPGLTPEEPIELPSIDADPIVDNHPIAIDILRGWLVSDAGRLAKKDNPEGYKNVLLRLKSHMKLMQDMEAAAAMSQPQNTENSGSNSSNSKKPAKPGNPNQKIQGEKDARTPVS